jgi:hypothetical protein
MITRALWFLGGLLVSRLLRERDEFEDRLDALEAEADERAACDCQASRDADGRERSESN